MSKIKMIPLISLFVMSLILYGWVGFTQSPSPRVQLNSDPPMGQIFPFEAEALTPQLPVKLTLQAVDETGKALENAKIHLTLLTPPKNPWLSTDFPIVEGTELLDLEANAPKGELQIQQILPIRGTYKLLVNVAPVGGNSFAPFQQTLTLPVAENSLKYRSFAILAFILLIVGLVGGLMIGGEQKIEPGEVAPHRVRLLLSGAIVVAIASLLYLNITAEVADSHTSHHSDRPSHSTLKVDNSGIVQAEEIQVKLSGDRNATVGKLAKLQAQVTDSKTNQPVTDINLSVKTIQLEDRWVAFAYQGVGDGKGNLTWQQQFFDGAPHKLEIEISPQPNAKRQFKPLLVSQEIEVEGIAPPLQVRLIALAYLTGIVVLGLLLGLKLRQSPSFFRLAGERKH